jgi:hypothetical protein
MSGSARVGARDTLRGSRCRWITASNSTVDNLAVVSVEDRLPRVIEGQLDTADLDLVRRYIVLNRAAILDHWHEKTDGAEVIRALRRLP